MTRVRPREAGHVAAPAIRYGGTLVALPRPTRAIPMLISCLIHLRIGLPDNLLSSHTCGDNDSVDRCIPMHSFLLTRPQVLQPHFALSQIRMATASHAHRGAALRMSHVRSSEDEERNIVMGVWLHSKQHCCLSDGTSVCKATAHKNHLKSALLGPSLNFSVLTSLALNITP